MYAVCTCFNIDEVYVTPPLFHKTITYLPIPTEIIFPGVKAETLVSVATDSIMRLVSTKPLSFTDQLFRSLINFPPNFLFFLSLPPVTLSIDLFLFPSRGGSRAVQVTVRLE